MAQPSCGPCSQFPGCWWVVSGWTCSRAMQGQWAALRVSHGVEHLLVPRDTCTCLGQGHTAGGCQTSWKMSNPLSVRTELWPLYMRHSGQIWRGVAFLHRHFNSLPRDTHILRMLVPWSHCTRSGGGAFMRRHVGARATYPRIG